MKEKNDAGSLRPWYSTYRRSDIYNTTTHNTTKVRMMNKILLEFWNFNNRCKIYQFLYGNPWTLKKTQNQATQHIEGEESSLVTKLWDVKENLTAWVLHTFHTHRDSSAFNTTNILQTLNRERGSGTSLLQQTVI